MSENDGSLPVVIKESCLSLSGNHMFGRAGGQLEYVSQRIEWQIGPNGGHYAVVIMRFTDHDHHFNSKEDPQTEGMIDNKYYELEFPVSDMP